MSQTIVSQTVTPFAGGTVTHTVYNDGTISDAVTWDAGTPPANEASLRSLALAAFIANRTYVALAAPTAAQTTAQVKALSRQMNGVMRLILNQYDGTD